ncbi:uncharacterized protein LOC110435506 [Sorghum bicolor]|uniref:uncharacterized protein LOC110435506 n=1 Tax=Sorghum bicolor TaxID=4558 RepID=UPI000B424228|nr:uncharacterized protein LOC110430153 isoform X1 [Sorghum bicolor]XP_021311729.1 uncharacterized protein LOC110433592 isoform X3 [Sorghum bicolor]XP_021312422.1 uncharacterized protein LOC110433870 isoform X1 [Sorghum bicolor]XP_021316792.1 uncharacterized protein LOC110435506 [Sorghum bicolor]|eukprot:XP_021302915.1 uncharacterized protein LOC110430153 isoform X1 [Sorghum bicolor]
MSPLKHDVGLLRWSYIIFILVAMYEQLPLKHVENNCSQARRSLAGLHARPASPTRSLPFPYQPHTTPEQPWFDPSKKENKPRLRIHHAPVFLLLVWIMIFDLALDPNLVFQVHKLNRLGGWKGCAFNLIPSAFIITSSGQQCYMPLSSLPVLATEQILFNQVMSMSPFQCGKRPFRRNTENNDYLLWKKFLEMTQTLVEILL